MYDKNNIFAKIIRSEVPARIVFEDEFCLCFKDINPVAKTHLLVIPKIEAVDYADFIVKAKARDVQGFFTSIKTITDKLNLNHYKLLTNKGGESGQQVFHFHVHVISQQDIEV